jgi:putative FmdB family regulatory protein
MPLYEYQCESCKTIHEAQSSISRRDREDVACPKCGELGCKRLVSAAAVMGGVGLRDSAPAPAPT